jgi:hypothetical protein
MWRCTEMALAGSHRIAPLHSAVSAQSLPSTTNLRPPDRGEFRNAANSSIRTIAARVLHYHHLASRFLFPSASLSQASKVSSPYGYNKTSLSERVAAS